MPCVKVKGWSYNRRNKLWYKRKKGKRGWITRKTKP